MNPYSFFLTGVTRRIAAVVETQQPRPLHRLHLQSRRDWSEQGGHFCTKWPGIRDQWLFSKFTLKELGVLHMIS